ncbi:divalent-cation tolerance protein CutA [Streptomyces sp. NPDC002055]|uniref:divalent-cation tolerance protein CutA n=1 Tax=Streptomyces sp. NPDC002055 TaxID=3154534 RepID=UPI00332EAC68
MANEIVIAQTTIDDEGQAMALARGAVESKLAAGVHIDAPVTAVYWWKSEVETAREWRISYMTTTDHLQQLEAWLSENHPYDVPQWITLPVTGGSEAYLSWVVEETSRG